MLSFIIPTRDRHEHLERTLAALGALAGLEGAPDAEVVIADNDSERPVRTPSALGGRWPVRVIRLGRNLGAAARNLAARAADPASRWLVMLDDDSHPVDLRFAGVLADVGPDVAAVMADIHLPAAGCRESGGLPEVFIGCGVALRREAFLDAGGYDAAFHYYAEEYDLAARLLLNGWRVEFAPAFVVDHFKVSQKRDMSVVLARLVRNNGWVAQRYAPDSRDAGTPRSERAGDGERSRRDELQEIRRRYRRIAIKEDAVDGYARGLIELRRTLGAQPRTPLSRRLFDRFTGLEAARRGIGAAWRAAPFDAARVIAEGKNAWAVRRALREHGVRETPDAQVAVIGTLSPGPMLDAWRTAAAGRVVVPWAIPGVEQASPGVARRLAA